MDHQELFERLEPVSFLLMKVILLVKYFLFVRYRDISWTISELFYYSKKQLQVDPSPAKKIQNHLTLIFVILVLIACGGS